MAEAPKLRRYTRVRLKPARWVAVESPGRRETYRCTAMGLGGLYLECAEPLPEGSLVRFALEIGGTTIRGTASVRDLSAGGVGLAFLTLKPDDRTRLRAFIEGQPKS